MLLRRETKVVPARRVLQRSPLRGGTTGNSQGWRCDGGVRVTSPRGHAAGLGIWRGVELGV